MDAMLWDATLIIIVGFVLAAVFLMVGTRLEAEVHIEPAQPDVMPAGTVLGYPARLLSADLGCLLHTRTSRRR